MFLRSRHWLLLAAFLTYDFGAFAVHARKAGVPFEATFCHWDSNWFADLIESGRNSEPTPKARSRWAFLPLVIEAVKAGSRLTHQSPYFVGSALSLACLALSVHLLARRKPGEAFGPPTTLWGWYFFLLSPASYALHTFHTEAPFLLLSLVCLHAAVDGRFWWSAAAVAAALWTRNQGVVLALTAAFVWWRRHGHQGALGLIAASLLSYALLLGYAALEAGTPFAFHRAQQNWDHVHSVPEVFGTLVMANEKEPWASTWVLRQLFGWGWLAMIAVHFKRRRSEEGLYAASSFAPMLLQGTFHNAFRFGAVMFSTLFAAGDAVAKAPKLVRWALGAAWLSLHHMVLLAWLKDQWAY